MAHNYYIVDVFSDIPYTGNQLAVVISDMQLSDNMMQKIAVETNYSETTFISPDPLEDGSFSVSIYTPAREIDFAGHPLLGTAWVIRQYLSEAPCNKVMLKLPIGLIPVMFDDNDVVWFEAPQVAPGNICPRDEMAAALGLSVADIDDDIPVQQMSAGVSASIVPLKSLSALRRSKLNLDVFSRLQKKGFAPLVYLFCKETLDSANDLSVRFFFDAHGVREDPATGNGAAFLGAYLLLHDMSSADGFSLRIEQGHSVSRPSLVMLRATESSRDRKIYVGGHVVATMQGKLLGLSS